MPSEAGSTGPPAINAKCTRHALTGWSHDEQIEERRLHGFRVRIARFDGEP